MYGYLICTGVYAALTLTCLTVWRRRLAGSGLAVAIAVQAAWSLVMVVEADRVPVPLTLLIGTEYLRDLAWALVLTRSLRGGDLRAGRYLQRIVAALVLLVMLGVFASLMLGESIRPIRALARYWLWGGLGLSIFGLVLIEQVARNTRPAHRWSLKHIWLAIGGLYAWDLCLFAALMLRASAGIEFWLVRGFVNSILGGLLAVGLHRLSGWKSAAFLSPRVVLFNATLLAASIFMLVLATGSYYVRELGGTWGGAGQLLFLAAGALVLAVAVLSDQFRAWTRVTLAKYLFPYRYDYRAEWRKLTRVLSESDDTPVYERIANVMAGFVNCTSSGLWLRDPEGAFLPVAGDLGSPDAPHEADAGEFFEYLLRNEWVFDVDEVRDAQKQTRRPVPPQWMIENTRIWLVVPLICENTLVGFTALGQPLAAMRLSWEEIDLLRAAGRQVASFLALEQAAKRLAEAHQFEAMNRLSAVLMHDLRHLVAQQALVVQNAARHRGNPEFFDDAILTIDNSVKRMTRLMDELRSGVLTAQSQRVELAELAAEAARHCDERKPAVTLAVRDRGVEITVNRDRLLRVLEHVVRNAQEATPPDGSVTIRISRAADRAVIEVADTGTGMDAQFIRERLFKPFDTTKGERGFGIGAYEAREFVRKSGGSVDVYSKPGKGTRFVINLPAAPVLSGPNELSSHELKTH